MVEHDLPMATLPAEVDVIDGQQDMPNDMEGDEDGNLEKMIVLLQMEHTNLPG